VGERLRLSARAARRIQPGTRGGSRRPIFGNARDMNAAGLRRKTNIDRYVRTWAAAG
jgi:hypothetical protein